MSVFLAITGLPGTGKTTYANKIWATKYDRLSAADVAMLAADDFFEDEETGEYQFDPRKLAEAHASCLSRFLSALQDGKELVIVHNTFSRAWELNHYITAAKLAGYETQIIQIQIETIEDLRIAADNNIHGVPAAAYGDMVMRWETHPAALRVAPWWRDES